MILSVANAKGVISPSYSVQLEGFNHPTEFSPKIKVFKSFSVGKSLVIKCLRAYNKCGQHSCLARACHLSVSLQLLIMNVGMLLLNPKIYSCRLEDICNGIIFLMHLRTLIICWKDYYQWENVMLNKNNDIVILHVL